MKTQEAIELLNNHWNLENYQFMKHEVDGIIELLEQGEVRKQIIDKAKKNNYAYVSSINGSSISLTKFLEKIEEKITEENKTPPVA